MQTQPGITRTVIVRDLLIFQLKVFLDGLKDLLLIQLALWATLFELLFGGRRRGRVFYGLLRIAERFDLWLNLYGPSRGAGASADGLFGSSRAGADTLLGRLEEAARGRVEGVRRTRPRHHPG